MFAKNIQYMLGATVKWSFVISFIFSLLGAYMKITHMNSADIILGIGLIVSGVFIVSAILEVQSSAVISSREKVMWIIGFLFMIGIAGLVYVLFGRKRILGSPYTSNH